MPIWSMLQLYLRNEFVCEEKVNRVVVVVVDASCQWLRTSITSIIQCGKRASVSNDLVHKPLSSSLTMEEVGLEETKPDVDVKIEDDVQPEPDETLMMDQGNGRVWSVKLPKHLMVSWSASPKDGIHLATMRVYDADPKTRKQRMVLLVPSTPRDPSDPASMQPPTFAPGTYDEYELEMLNDSVENQVVVAEREKEPNSRARTTILTGRVRHECALRPKLTEAYRRRLRERSKAANTPKRTVKEMDIKEAGGLGRMNRLGAGIGTSGPGFSNFIVRVATIYNTNCNLTSFFNTEIEAEACEGPV